MAKYAANIAWVLLIDEVSFSLDDFFPVKLAYRPKKKIE